MTYVDLDLCKIDEKNSQSYTLAEAIGNNELIVLLGAPGSGKTSMLKSFEANNAQDTKLINVKSYLKIKKDLCENVKILLLDGLDEYRNTAFDKSSFVLTELGDKINSLKETKKEIKIVISCREMDWYGESDNTALRDEINKKVSIFKILPLNDKKKKEFADMLKISEPNQFIESFSSFGFLDNPQMFVMMADAYKKNPQYKISSKKELYLDFIKNAREQNSNYTTNRLNELEPEKRLRCVGYLAFFYMFSELECFNDEIIKNICDQDRGYGEEHLKIVLNSTLFRERTFIHRTIAEFSLAYFVKQSKKNMDINRIKSLFIRKGKIPTELRGTYSWLCSLTQDESLISEDPYYQAVHGDNSSFSNDLKTRVVLNVKEYAKRKPYFITFSKPLTLEGFYNRDLDDFFIKEFKCALELTSHYIYFIINAMTSSSKLSPEMINFLKENILDNSISMPIKRSLIMTRIILENNDFLKMVLDQIKDNTLSDVKDELKELILRLLYPKVITSREIAEHLFIYHEDDLNYHFYLYETPYDEKRDLIEQICKKNYNKNKTPSLLLPKSLIKFIEDYFLETLLEYERLTAREIHDIIWHFKKDYEGETVFHAYRSIISDKFRSEKEKLDRLAIELFSIFIDKMLSQCKTFEVHEFNRLFNLNLPKNASEILFGKLNTDCNFEQKKNLFFQALYRLTRAEQESENIRAKAKEFGLENDYEEWLKSSTPRWGAETWIPKDEKAELTVDTNERHFSRKTDEEILKNFSELSFIAKLFFYETHGYEQKPLTQETMTRLEGILKKALFADLTNPELLSLQSLSISAPEANRNIDIMYYTSCSLNELSDVSTTPLPPDFLKYLYIVSVVNRNVKGIKSNKNFLEHIETKYLSFAKGALIEYIELLLGTYLKDAKDCIEHHIREEEDIENLKKIATLNGVAPSGFDNRILFNILFVFNFKFSCSELKRLDEFDWLEKNKTLIRALITFSEERIQDFTISMAISLYSLIDHRWTFFNSLEGNLKAKIIDYMMRVFAEEDLTKKNHGTLSLKYECMDFLKRRALDLLDLDRLRLLRNWRLEDDFWSNLVKEKLHEKEQEETDSGIQSYSIESIKNFILSDVIISKEDFFRYVVSKIESLKIEIEENRSDIIKFFYDSDSSRDENGCRDLIMLRLSDKYSYDLELIKEKYEANNRVDINIKYKTDSTYEVQIECKKDNNRTIIQDLEKQLIEKYITSSAPYGIYLIFYFDESVLGKEALIKKLEGSIPEDKKDYIKVICIDLRRK